MFSYPVSYIAWLSRVLYVMAQAQVPMADNEATLDALPPLRRVEHISDGLTNGFLSVPPRCSRSTSNSEEYCVYTSANFASGRGISIFTKPSQATQLLQLPSFTDSETLSSLGVNELVGPPFNTVQLKGRGVGFITNRTVKRGEWLMSFTPAFMTVKEAMDGSSREDRLSLQRLAFEQLPLPLRDTTYALYNQRGNTADDFIDDIIATNSFELALKMKLGDEDELHEFDYKILFPEIARFNHACRPTADYFFDSSLLVLHIIAFRDILPGEELTITYIDPLQKRQARQKALRRLWGFVCDCAACSAPPKLAQASDARIDRIMELQDELVDRTRESKGSPVLAKKLISLMQQEQLWTLMHEGYFAAAIEYSGIGDAANAQKYAMLALQSSLLCRGSEAVDDWHLDVVLLSNDPERHPSWKFRVLK